MKKTLVNSDKNGTEKNVSDLEFYGNKDSFQLICKTSSQAEGWMKSTKAMQIDGVGCLVQVSTQHGASVAEALTFVPDVKIAWIDDNDHSKGRKLVKI
jgi:hypothetical protein